MDRTACTRVHFAFTHPSGQQNSFLCPKALLHRFKSLLHPRDLSHFFLLLLSFNALLCSNDTFFCISNNFPRNWNEKSEETLIVFQSNNLITLQNREEYRLLTLDIKVLYFNVSTNEVIRITHAFLTYNNTDETLFKKLHILNNILHQNYFRQNN